MYNRKLDIWLGRHSYKVVRLFSDMCYGYIYIQNMPFSATNVFMSFWNIPTLHSAIFSNYTTGTSVFIQAEHECMLYNCYVPLTGESVTRQLHLL